VYEDFWKSRYRQFWAETAAKEEQVKVMIETVCGVQVEYAGLGAGSSEYIASNAASKGLPKGAADLHVLGTDIYVEVTGSNTEKTDRYDDLWIRPDKIEAARTSKGNHWVVHLLKKNHEARIIHVDRDFIETYDAGLFKVEQHSIRGTVEKFVAVPARSPWVENISVLLDLIKKNARQETPQ
jgi:hypothetical protein